MRRTLRFIALGGLVVWLVRRRLGVASQHAEQVTIGFVDGSSTVLEVGSPERELLVAAAGEAW
jgi:hypothetical protein